MRALLPFCTGLVLVIAAPPHLAAQPAAPPAAAAPADEQHGAALERDLEQRWGRTRAIQVVENRLFPKAHRFELAVIAAVLPNDPFLIYLNPGLRLAWHFNERLALEVGGAYAVGFDSQLRRDLTAADALIQARLRDRVLGRFGVALLWSPVYGKFAFNNRKLGHFDLYFVLEGSGLIADKVPEMNLKGGVWGGVGLGVGFRFYLTRLLSLRVELRQRVELREGLGDEALRVSWPTEVSLGLSFLLGRGPQPEKR